MAPTKIESYVQTGFIYTAIPSRKSKARINEIPLKFYRRFRYYGPYGLQQDVPIIKIDDDIEEILNFLDTPPARSVDTRDKYHSRIIYGVGWAYMGNVIGGYNCPCYKAYAAFVERMRLNGHAMPEKLDLINVAFSPEAGIILTEYGKTLSAFLNF